MSASLESLRVLVIEDDPFQRRVAVNLLRALPVREVLEAGSGQEALNVVSATREGIDVALVDLKLPGVDGVQLIRMMARDRLVPAIIIATSFDQQIQVAAEAMASAHGIEVLGTIAKPLTGLRLRGLLERYRGGAFKSREEAAWEPDADALREALETQALTVHYQPEVELASLQVLAMEALVRWDHPDGGLLLPGSFLDLAEESGLMRRLTEFVFDRALGDRAAWHKAGLETRLAVNIAASTLDRPGAAEVLHRRVAAKGASARDVCIEVTEHSAACDNIIVVENLLQLRLAGFALALDDYGTGSATLQQLNRLPLTQLKIDRSFVTDSARRKPWRTLLESSLDLARRLGLQSVAEGVENEEDWDLVRDLGCDVAQGHLIAHAMPADAIADWHQSWLRGR